MLGIDEIDFSKRRVKKGTKVINGNVLKFYDERNSISYEQIILVYDPL